MNSHVKDPKVDAIAEKILAAFPKRKLSRILGLTRPLWHRAVFDDTAEEIALLNEEILKARTRRSTANKFYHVGKAETCNDLCRILLDGKVFFKEEMLDFLNRPFVGLEFTKSTFEKCSWGIFITTSEILTACRKSDRDHEKFAFFAPIKRYEAILLPTPLVQVVAGEFPQYKNLLKGYRKFAEELSKL